MKPEGDLPSILYALFKPVEFKIGTTPVFEQTERVYSFDGLPYQQYLTVIKKGDEALCALAGISITEPTLS